MLISKRNAVWCCLIIGLIAAVPACDRSEESQKPVTAAGREDKKTRATGFNGTFHATVNGDASVITLQQNGNKLTGTVENASIDGEVNGNTAQGSLKESAGGEALPMRLALTLNGNELTVRLTAKNAETGEEVTMPDVVYTREGASVDAINTVTKTDDKPAVAGDEEHDPALVGAWRYTYAAAGGGASVAVDDWLYIQADGTYRIGDSHAAGGNGDVGIEASGSGGGFIGQWRSADRRLHLKQEGTAQWENVARYYVEGDKMLLTYGNGSKKIWYRQ